MALNGLHGAVPLAPPDPLATQKPKCLFGYFTYTDLEGERIRISPQRVKEIIVEFEIPYLTRLTSTQGEVPFHVEGAEQLRNAFEETRRQGLVKHVLAWVGAGLRGTPGGTSARRCRGTHAGIAFDFNVRWNGYGKEPPAENECRTVRPLVPIFEAISDHQGPDWIADVLVSKGRNGA